MTRAEAELSRAAQVVAAKKRVQQRMASKLEGKLSDKQLGRFMRLFKEAHTAHLQALFDETQDENLLLQLKLELSELQRDMYFAEWGRLWSKRPRQTHGPIAFVRLRSGQCAKCETVESRISGPPWTQTLILGILEMPNCISFSWYIDLGA